jgi:hypothetical protein
MNMKHVNTVWRNLIAPLLATAALLTISVVIKNAQ